MIFTTNTLREELKDYSNPLSKIKRDVDEGKLFRLNRGLYETNKNVNPCFLASSIVPLSYLSYEWALSYYGLIPERVVAITSASYNLRKNKTFNNYFGRFEYSDVNKKVFSKGLTYIQDGNYVVKIASKEKAICDSLSKWRVVKSVKELKTLLFEDKRINLSEFETCDFTDMLKIASYYKKTNLYFLIKFITKNYLNRNI